MIEIYPKKINMANVKAEWQKLVSAFLVAAEDPNPYFESDHQSIEEEQVSSFQNLKSVFQPVFQKNTSK